MIPIDSSIFLFFIFAAANLDLRPELLSGYGEEPGASDNIDTSANLIDGAQIAHTERSAAISWEQWGGEI